MQGRTVQGRRSRVERHIKIKSTAASGQGARTGRNSFPLCSSWLVEVHMSVNESGKKERTGRVDDLRGVASYVRTDRDNPLSRNSDIRYKYLFRRAQRTAVDNE